MHETRINNFIVKKTELEKKQACIISFVKQTKMEVKTHRSNIQGTQQSQTFTVHLFPYQAGLEEELLTAGIMRRL